MIQLPLSRVIVSEFAPVFTAPSGIWKISGTVSAALAAWRPSPHAA